MAPPAAPAGADIAQDALKYAGQRYTYGGPADRPGDWDCSSFVSYVLGHDLGMVLPGGGRYGSPAYPPHAHGPVVLSYAGWAGATTLPAGMAPAAGDLCVWAGAGPLGHIGIALDGTHMISALDTQYGTLVTPIAGNGPAGVTVQYRRINGAAQTATLGLVGDGTSTTGAGYAALAGSVIAAGVLPLAFAGAILGIAAVVGVGLAAVTVWALSRAGGAGQ
jgi:cell wall-associated NlpC family hydrolase